MVKFSHTPIDILCIHSYDLSILVANLLWIYLFECEIQTLKMNFIKNVYFVIK